MSRHHISLPKTTLLRFSNSGNLSYMDLRTNIIEETKAKSYNTAINYYPSHSENYLSAGIETELGRLATKMENYRSKNTPFRYDFEKIADWIIAQWVRTSNAREVSQKGSMFGNILPSEWYSQFIRNSFEGFVGVGKNILKNSIQNHDIKLGFTLKDSRSTFLLNTTHCLFVNDLIFFILSPHTCICCIPPRYDYKESDLVIFDDVFIDSLIPSYIHHETRSGDGHLIGHKDQLLKVKKYVDESKDILQNGEQST